MNLWATIEFQCYGTSEGVERAWDTRGRGRKVNPKAQYDALEARIQALDKKSDSMNSDSSRYKQTMRLIRSLARQQGALYAKYRDIIDPARAGRVAKAARRSLGGIKTFYHGTSVANGKEILRSGLRAPKGEGAYLTARKGLAQSYGGGENAHWEGYPQARRYAVVEMNLPQDVKERLESDTMQRTTSWRRGAWEMEHYIPAEHMKAVHVYEMGTDKHLYTLRK